MVTSGPWRFAPVKQPSNTLNMRLDGPQGRSGRFGEEKSVSVAGFRTPDYPSRSLVTLPMALFQLVTVLITQTVPNALLTFFFDKTSVSIGHDSLRIPFAPK
jgi:hypothetical protein